MLIHLELKLFEEIYTLRTKQKRFFLFFNFPFNDLLWLTFVVVVDDVDVEVEVVDVEVVVIVVPK